MRREYYATLSSGIGNGGGGGTINNDNSSNNDALVEATFSSNYNTDNKYYDTETSEEMATTAIYSITSIFLLTLVYLASMQIATTTTFGSKVEFTLLVLLIGLSCTAVSTATNPIYGLSINPISGDVGFGNLYYSSWATWTCVVALVLSYIRTEYGIDAVMEMKLRGGTRLLLWICLIALNLLVMASSATCYDAKCGISHHDGKNNDLIESNKIYYDNGQNNNNTNELDPWEESRSKKYCHRAAFGVSVGCIGCVTSLSVVAMRLAGATTATTSSIPSSFSPQENVGDGDSQSKRIIFVVECISSWILLFMNCFSVAYLTSEGGPGAPLGNLFYATWITFVLVIYLAVSCFGEVQMAKKIYQRRYLRQGSSADITTSDEGMGMESISSLNLSSANNFERRSTGGFSSSRFDDYDSEDAPSMLIRPTCSGSVVEVQVGD